MVDRNTVNGLDGLVDLKAEAHLLSSESVWAEGLASISRTGTARWSDIPEAGSSSAPSTRRRQPSTKQKLSTATAARYTMTAAPQCSHVRGWIERERGGEVTPVLSSWNVVGFNSPNDVIDANDCSIWFSDLSHGVT